MITCKYCGVHYDTFRSTCPSCGAPLRIEEEGVPEKADAQIISHKVHRICDEHMSRDFKDGESIPEKKMDKLRKSFRVFPNGKEIFLYCDTTPFRTGNQGFLICEDGVYWQNSWTTPTNRNFINWDTFKRREITHKKYELDLDKGDVIELSGLGSNALEESVTKLFKHIRDALNE